MYTLELMSYLTFDVDFPRFIYYNTAKQAVEKNFRSFERIMLADSRVSQECPVYT